MEFKRGDPTGITKKLRLVLEKAERHCVPIEWEMFGPEAVAHLSRRDPTFAQALTAFGPNGARYLAHKNKSDSASLIDQLFAEIDIAAHQLVASQGDAKTFWAGNSAEDSGIRGVNAIMIKDPEIRATWESKVLDNKGAVNSGGSKTKANEPGLRLNQSMRCEAIGCHNDVSMQGQQVCNRCHGKARKHGHVQLIGSSRYFIYHGKRHHQSGNGPDDKGSKRKRDALISTPDLQMANESDDDEPSIDESPTARGANNKQNGGLMSKSKSKRMKHAAALCERLGIKIPE